MTQRLRSSDVICGLPALEARRELLRISGLYMPGIVDPSTQSRRETLAAAFVDEGYLEVEEDGRIQVTDKGAALCRGKANNGFRRETCGKALAGLMSRAADLNSHPRMPLYVESIVVFGSYLGDQPMLGDLDLSIRFRNRYGADSHRLLEEERRRIAWLLGKRLYGVDLYTWDYVESIRFLKGRGSVLSIEPLDEEFLAGIPHQTHVLPDPTVVQEESLFNGPTPVIHQFNGTAWAVRDQVLTLLTDVVRRFARDEGAFVTSIGGDWPSTESAKARDINWFSAQSDLTLAWSKAEQTRFLMGAGPFALHCFQQGPDGMSARLAARVGRSLIEAGIPEEWVRIDGPSHDQILVGP